MKRFCRDNPVERLGYQKHGVLDIKKHRWFQVRLLLCISSLHDNFMPVSDIHLVLRFLLRSYLFLSLLLSICFFLFLRSLPCYFYPCQYFHTGYFVDACPELTKGYRVDVYKTYIFQIHIGHTIATSTTHWNFIDTCMTYINGNILQLHV